MDGLVPSEGPRINPYRDGLTLRRVSPVVLPRSDPCRITACSWKNVLVLSQFSLFFAFFWPLYVCDLYICLLLNIMNNAPNGSEATVAARCHCFKPISFNVTRGCCLLQFLLFFPFLFCIRFSYIGHYQHYHDTDQRSFRIPWVSHLVIQFPLGPHQLSRRTTEDVSFHCRRFTGEFEFRVPRGEASLMAQRVMIRLFRCTVCRFRNINANWEYFKFKINFISLGLSLNLPIWRMPGNQTGWIPGLHFIFPNSSGQIATSVTTCSDWSSNDLRTAIENDFRSEKCIGNLQDRKRGSGSLGQVWYDSISARHFRTSVGELRTSKAMSLLKFLQRLKQKSLCFKIGRQPEKFISSSVLQVMEFEHPQLEHVGHHLWVSHPLARFSSNKFDAIRNGTLKELDWCGLYSTVLRLHSDLYQNPQIESLEDLRWADLLKNHVKQKWDSRHASFLSSQRLSNLRWSQTNEWFLVWICHTWFAHMLSISLHELTSCSCGGRNPHSDCSLDAISSQLYFDRGISDIDVFLFFWTWRRNRTMYRSFTSLLLRPLQLQPLVN